MRILMIVPYVPNRIRVRPYHLLTTLAARGHEVTLATLWDNQAQQVELEALRELGAKVIAWPLSRPGILGNLLTALPTQTPLQARYCWQPGLASAVAHHVASTPVDVVHVEHLRGAVYGLEAKQALAEIGKRIPIIWDSVDSISSLFAQAAQRGCSLTTRLVARLDLARTRRHEARLVTEFDRTLVTSSQDCQAFAGLLAQRPPTQMDLSAALRRLVVLQNGVDVDYFTPGAEARLVNTLVFSGKMSYHANVAAAHYLVHTIMPLVWAKVPDAQLWIVGKEPTAAVRALEHAGNGRESGRVVVTGTVPDLRPYLRETAVAVAPLTYGAGIQNKVLEAMACGAPVVATPQAVSALDVTSGHECLVAEDAGTFAQGVVSLLRSPRQARQIGEAGRHFVQTQYAWDTQVQRLEEIYQQAVEEIAG